MRRGGSLDAPPALLNKPIFRRDDFMRVLLCFVLFAATACGDEFEINKKQRLLETGANSSTLLGERLPQLAFHDLEGNTVRVADEKATAFVFLSTSCPMAKRYTQRLNRLREAFSSQGVALYGIFSNHEDDREGIAKHATQMSFEFPVAKDVNGYLATKLGAKMTPQAVVVDRLGMVRYRGAIDDNRYENRVRQHYLREALTAICSDQEVDAKETKSLGCSIHLPKREQDSEVNYTQHVARILQDNCQSCHRPGQVAPFSLTDYDEARTWANEIRHYTKARLMPPWKAAPDFGKFHGDRSLKASDIQLIEQWVQGGTPQGPVEAMPPAPRFADTWALGTPDLIVEMPEEYTIGPEGEDDYRHFIIPTNFDKDMFVRASDVIPGNRQTVHHVIAYVDTTGVARQLDAKDPGPGYTRFGDVGFEASSVVAGWAPGVAPKPTPDGTGFWLPKGGDIVMQVHYYRTGREERDRTKLGLYFCESSDTKVISSGVAINTKFKIPPGANRHKVEAAWHVDEDRYAISVAPHMHLLGKEMKVVAKLPNGDVLPMIWIKDWDFNWQGSYEFEEPLFLPKGTSVQATAYFDNSPENPNNPNTPPKAVGWGEKTTDEMCIAFVACVKAKEWQPKRPVNRVASK